MSHVREIQKRKLHYEESGQGDITLVFLHYFGGAASTWERIISYLENEFRCIAVDLLGFGYSPSQDELISVNDSANAVLELISHLSLHNYVLIGHSMGGKIALRVASMQPGGLLSLTLLAPSPPTAEPMTEKEREEMDKSFSDREKVEKMIGNVIAQPLAENDFNKEVNNNLQVSSAGWHSWPQAGSKEIIADKMEDVHVPVSILYGEKDKKFTKSFLQKEFDQYFKTYSLIEIKKSGHLLPVEAPEEVAKEIRLSALGFMK